MENGVSFISACKNFFGFKEGQSLHEFSQEVKQLSEKDRSELKEEFSKVGINVRD